MTVSGILQGVLCPNRDCSRSNNLSFSKSVFENISSLKCPYCNTCFDLRNTIENQLDLGEDGIRAIIWSLLEVPLFVAKKTYNSTLVLEFDYDDLKIPEELSIEILWTSLTDFSGTGFNCMSFFLQGFNTYPNTLELPIRIKGIPEEGKEPSSYSESEFPSCQVCILAIEKNNTQKSSAIEFIIEAWKHWSSQNFTGCMLHLGTAIELIFSKIIQEVELKQLSSFQKKKNAWTLGYYRKKFFPFCAKKLHGGEPRFPLIEKCKIPWNQANTHLQMIVDKRNDCVHRGLTPNKEEMSNMLTTGLLLYQYSKLVLQVISSDS